MNTTRIFTPLALIFAAACGADGDSTSDADYSYSPSDPYGGDTGGSTGSTGSNPTPQVCVFQHSSRFACPGINDYSPAKWECDSYNTTLSTCRDWNESDVSCDGDCCSDDTYFDHRIVNGPCSAALANIESGGTGGACQAFQSACTLHSDCCDGLICVNWGSAVVCSYPCDTGSDCNGGCCTPLQEGGGTCANPDLYCAD